MTDDALRRVVGAAREWVAEHNHRAWEDLGPASVGESVKREMQLTVELIAAVAALDKAPEGAAPRVAVYSEETERDLDTYKWPLGSEKYPTDTAPQSGASGGGSRVSLEVAGQSGMHGQPRIEASAPPVAPPAVQHCAGCSGTADLTFKGNEIALPCPGLPVAAPPALSTEEIEEIAAAVEHVQDDGGEWYCMESAIAKRIRDLLARTPKPQGGGT
jgi:hypothetical protein